MNYRREIDGLRAVAVLPVMLFHAGFQSFSGGFVGVDIFFVISGYLITSIILAEKQAGTFTLVGFYERRARRILPALFVVMFVSSAMSWLWLLPIDMKMFSQSLVAVPAFASNILFYLTSSYFEPAAELKPLLHTWSLSVEEQYYVLYPIFLLIAWRFGKSERWIVVALILLTVLSLAAAQYGSTTDPSFAFFLLPTRGWEILVGALIGFYVFKASSDASPTQRRTTVVRQILSMVGLMLCAYGVWAFDARTPYPSFYTLVPTIGTACIILFATHDTFVGKLLGHSWLVGIGLISYSAYLWHQPLFVLARHRSIESPSSSLLLSLVVASLLLAYFNWKYVETPVRRKQSISRKQVVTIGASCSIAFMAVGLIGHLSGGFPHRVTQDVLAAQQAQFDELGCLSEVGKYIPVAESCIVGDARHVRGVLLGDSIAGTLGHELGKALANQSVGVMNMSFGHCPPVMGVYRVDQGSTHRCPEHNEAVFNYVKERNTLNIVILAGYWTSYIESPLLDIFSSNGRRRTPDDQRTRLIKEAFVDTIVRYIKTGKTVVLVYPIPEAGRHVPRYLAKHAMFSNGHASDRDLMTGYEAYKVRNQETIHVFDSIGEHPNLIRIRPDLIFCNTYIEASCVAHVNGNSLYRDEFHLSNLGAHLVVQEIMRHIAVDPTDKS
ncbi:MAG: acyltransferase [Nitrospira sp.]|nr:acyltransferase [Nitrospira sp.]